MDGEARALACGQCGAAAAEGARVCVYCRAALFTRHCGACYHANLPDADHCQGCGRPLGLAPEPMPDTLACPSCRTPAQAIATGEAGDLHACAACGGQFLEHPTLRALLEEHSRVPSFERTPRVTIPPASVAIRYLPCPICSTLMNRKNFGDHSGVVVDVCRAHGVWFDAGELPRVLAFVERGGLQEAARREAERRREESRAAAEAALGARVSMLAAEYRDYRDDARLLLDALFTLLRR